VVFVDSNVAMYVVGAPHPNRDRLEAFLRSHENETYVTSAEVYQEVIHRYVAINRRQAIKDCFSFLDDLVRSVHPITKQDTERAGTRSSSSSKFLAVISTTPRAGLDQFISPISPLHLFPFVSVN